MVSGVRNTAVKRPLDGLRKALKAIMMMIAAAMIFAGKGCKT
jgi:hypothetical protein